MNFVQQAYQEAKDAEKEQNKKRNIEQCGSRRGHFDGYSGKFKALTFFCHYHRECPTCLRKRQSEYIGRLERFANDGNLLFRTVFESEGQLRGFLRRVGADGYLRCPTDGGFAVYHGEEWQMDDSQIVVLNDETKEAIADDFNTPEGSRITGNLGKKKEEEESGPKGKATYKVYALSAVTPEMLIGAKREADKVGLTFPITEESLQEAISRRETVMEEWFEKRNVTLPVVYTVTTEFALHRVDWSITSIKESPVSDDEWIEYENIDQPLLWEPAEVFKEPGLG